jgi:hypothetical protein
MVASNCRSPGLGHKFGRAYRMLMCHDYFSVTSFHTSPNRVLGSFCAFGGLCTAGESSMLNSHRASQRREKYSPELKQSSALRTLGLSSRCRNAVGSGDRVLHSHHNSLPLDTSIHTMQEQVSRRRQRLMTRARLRDCLRGTEPDLQDHFLLGYPC